MKVLHINSSDISGGDRAVYRLHKGLCDIGIDSYMYVQSKFTDDFTVLSAENKLQKLVFQIKRHANSLSLWRYRNRSNAIFSPAMIMDNIISIINKIDPDIVHLHWLGHGFFRIETLSKIDKPIVWTMHDLWAITGGCHYPAACTRYYDKCGKCPELGSDKEHDLSRRVWKRKERAWRNIRIAVSSPSEWLAEPMKISPILAKANVSVIPNGIDCKLFKPIDRNIARQILSLPTGKKLILFGAMSSTSDKRKGFYLLEKSIEILERKGYADNFELVIFGASMPKHAQSTKLIKRYVGLLNDEYSMSVLYSAVDVFVAPSVQDNLPNTVMESLSCGTPIVAFNIGGMPDLIKHKHTGYLARPFEEEDLAEGIVWVIENEKRRLEMSENCRDKAISEYEITKISDRYKSLYKELL